MIFRSLFAIVLCFCFLSCEYWPKVDQDDLVARVGTHYLYRSDLMEHLPADLSLSDSTLLAQNYVNTWAKKYLLYDQSLLNLQQSKQKALDILVENYRLDLWARTYKTSLVNETVSVDIPMDVLQQYYDENQGNFQLKEDALKVRFLVMSKDIINSELIREKFINDSEDDKMFLDSLRFQFKTMNNSKATWFSKRDFLRQFPVIAPSQIENYLKKSQFFALEDSIEVYLFWITDFRLHNETAPFPLVEKTIRKIVYNKRKLDFIKQFDQEILQDAIQTKKFEIYP